MAHTVELVGLTQGYGRKVVVSGLNLKLTKGIFGLLGPNGAGKTTLLRTLATIAPPMGGELRLCGKQVRSASDVRVVRRQIGYLPQHFGFFPGFTVYEFVRYCAWLREMPSAEAHGATLAAMRAVDLGEQEKTKLRKLSGGMLRRAGLAQAIVGSPRLLLLDEPTVGLDPTQRLEFRSLIRSLKDVTVVLSTHLVEDVAATSDQVLVMNSGGITFRGSPDQLVREASAGARGDTELERGYTSVLHRVVA